MDRARKALVASSESQEERASRLEHKNAFKRQRLTDETDKERVARLELMQQRLVAESKEERATRLENVQPDQHLPPCEQRCVQSAMRSFHQEMSTIDTPTCSTCPPPYVNLAPLIITKLIFKHLSSSAPPDAVATAPPSFLNTPFAKFLHTALLITVVVKGSIA